MSDFPQEASRGASRETPKSVTRVVNLGARLPYDVYIGRFHRGRRYGLLPRSKWATLAADTTAARSLMLSDTRRAAASSGFRTAPSRPRCA